METVRVHVVARGRVQGVGYRFFVLEAAQMLGLSGWVMNCEDGSVEAEIEGDAAIVEQLITAMRSGPSAAHVKDIISNIIPQTGHLTGFRVRHL